MEDQITIPEQEAAPATSANVEVVDIQFRPGQKIYFFDPDGMSFVPGDHVIIDTARGAEFGYVTGGNHRIPERDVVAPLRKVLRRASAQDEKTHEENRAKEARAYEVCLQKIESHGLDMQLVSAEYAFDGSKILFYFTADERVDFRELVKNLAAVFHTRIELRQIGVRDKAKMVGGLGICGRPFCCKQFLEDFQPVSIKMAKTQNLSLNPTKISGTCGRLMCCLKYEQDAYESLIKTSPKVDSLVNTCDGMGTVTEASLLKQTVKVRMENDPSSVKVYNNCDICVLRSGKGKKNDPPIPADLPPLPKPVEKKEEPEIALFDESILSGYSESEAKPEKKAPEKSKSERQEKKNDKSRRQEKPQEAKTEEKEPQTHKKKSRSRRPDKKKKPTDGTLKVEPRAQKETKTEAKAETKAPAAENKTEGTKKSKSNNRRRYYRGHKKSSGNGGQNQNG